MNRESAIKTIVWVIPIIFAAGGVWWQVRAAVERMSILHVEVHDHTEEPAHPVGLQRLESLEKTQDEMLVEQRQQGQSLAAICQATGAQCR